MQNFEAAKRLRSNEFSVAALCALHRLAKHLPAHMAPIALRAITSALQFRGHLAPKCYRPLRVPFIAHAAYRNELRTCMRDHACLHFWVHKSCHSFSCAQVQVFPRHPRIAQALCNHQDALRQWAAKHHVVVRLSNAMPPKQRHTTRRRFGFSFPVWPVTGKGDQRQQWRNLFPGKSLHVGTIPPSLGIMVCH